MKEKYPIREDYISDKDYQEAISLYEQANFWESERLREKYYERNNK